MKKTEEIRDYASFLKAKYALKAEAEMERELIGEELKKGAHNLVPDKLFSGFADNFVSGLADRIIDSKIGQKVTSVLSMVSYLKDMFGKK